MIVIHQHPGSTPAPVERFTGSGFVDQLAIADAPSRLRAFSVHFTPGARSAWHCHPFGQILHVTEGVGRVQSEGGPSGGSAGPWTTALYEIRAGDTILTLPGEYHWHGAAPGSLMTHLAIQEADDNRVDAYWREHVNETTYLAAPSTPR